MFGLFAHTQVATGLGVGAAPITAASKMRRCVKKDVHVIRRGAVARARRRGVAVIDCAVSAPLDGRCAPAESQVYFKRGLTERGPTPTRYHCTVQRALGAGPVDWAGWRRGGRARARPWRLTFFRFYVHVHVVCPCTPCSVCDGRDSCLLVFGCRRYARLYGPVVTESARSMPLPARYGIDRDDGSEAVGSRGAPGGCRAPSLLTHAHARVVYMNGYATSATYPVGLHRLHTLILLCTRHGARIRVLSRSRHDGNSFHRTTAGVRADRRCPRVA